MMPNGKKFTENANKGLYKSNLPLVLDIQKQATKENNMTETDKIAESRIQHHQPN